MHKVSSLLSLAILMAGTVHAQSFTPAVAEAKVSPVESVWHLRAALNVAALNCRDADESSTIAGYNALISTQAKTFGVANDAVNSHYRSQYGDHWEDARESDMTKLYNYFAQPTGQASFCASAKRLLAAIAEVDGHDLPGFAQAALPMLKASFASATPSARTSTSVAFLTIPLPAPAPLPGSVEGSAPVALATLLPQERAPTAP